MLINSNIIIVFEAPAMRIIWLTESVRFILAHHTALNPYSGSSLIRTYDLKRRL